MVMRWTPQSSLELVRNPNYFLTPPGGADKYLQKVTYRFITDTNLLLVAMIGSSLDATSLATGLTFDQARSKQLASRAPGRFDIWFPQSDTLERMEINNYATPKAKGLTLDNPKTRQALAHALNRDAWDKAFFDGLEPVAHTFINPLNPMSNPGVPKYEYNPEKAKQLLAEVGWKPGPDGVLQRTLDGKTLRFELEYVTVAGNSIRERSQQFFLENLKQKGLRSR
jgi:peptide/nickel transport system substrate-binding protein